MKRTLGTIATALFLCAFAGAAFAADSATYTVTFTRLWSATAHPIEYPGEKAHLSGLIGATHRAGYKLFPLGQKPTPGLEHLSEMGKHTPLDTQIKKAISAKKAGSLFETGPLKTEGATETTTIILSNEYPLVSAVAMIAPSPDWFAGAEDVELMENGSWVATKTVEMYAYDSGGDDGTTFLAPDKNTNPKKPTMKFTAKQFAGTGPVATLTFTRK